MDGSRKNGEGAWLTVINVSTYLPAFSPTTARFFSSHNYKFLAEQKNNLNEESLGKVLKYELTSLSQPLLPTIWLICLPISFFK